MAVSITKADGIATVTIDNPPVNAASHAVRAGLLDAVQACDADPAVKTVILTCVGRTFVAGADIREFDKPPQEPHLPDLLNAIEAARTPWIACLHGTALGGGLELAMACRARVADPKAKMGLPEIALGLIPGAGGTVRLPRLVPAAKALEMVTLGKPVGAQEAHAVGLIDAIADDPAQYARQNGPALAGGKPTTARPPSPADDAFESAVQKARKKARGQENIPVAIAAVERALTLPWQEALDHERAAFLQLKTTDQSKALRRLFFAERATLSDPRCKATPRPVASVGVIGGGTMGAGIATACLIAGLPVILIEQTQDAAAAARARIDGFLDGSAKRGLIRDAAETGARLTTSTGYDALAQADLVIEAVFEDMAVKKQVFQTLEAHTKPQAILATNTSYLDVNEIAVTLQDPGRAIGLHFFSPAHVMKLLEIVTPQGVADDVIATVAGLAKRLRKIGVLSGVCDGFIANRIMSAWRREADYLIEDGASPYDVDAAMRDFGFPIGVFEMQDLAGLDIGWANRKRLAPTRDPAERYVHIADTLCEMGRFGRKTGLGWYSYASGSAAPDPQVLEIIDAARAAKGIAPEPIEQSACMARILSAMSAEAARVVDEGIARSREDVDVVLVNGYGFPRFKAGLIWDR